MPCLIEPLVCFLQPLLIHACAGFQLETDEKMRQRPQLHPAKMPRRRQVLPPWLQIVNWTPELRLTYKLPMTKAKNVLKKDREALKKIVQMEQTKVHLETLLEEMENPDYMPAMVSWKTWDSMFRLCRLLVRTPLLKPCGTPGVGPLWQLHSAFRGFSNGVFSCHEDHYR